MAKVSRGRLVTPAKLDDLAKEINALPEPQPLVDSIKLWTHWLAPAILIALLWIGRELNWTFKKAKDYGQSVDSVIFTRKNFVEI